MKLTVGIILALGNALLGAVIAELVSILRAWIDVRRRSNLTGEWLTTSHAGDQDQVPDRVRVSIRRGKLYMMNLDKTFGYSYEAWCRIRDKHIVEGTWRSTRPGAFNSGTVLLLISPQGNAMYGVYSGLGPGGDQMLLGWVFGRDKESLDTATSLLRQHLVMMPGAAASTVVSK